MRYRNGYCYSKPELNTRDNCCIPRRGYCINNFDEDDHNCSDTTKELILQMMLWLVIIIVV